MQFVTLLLVAWASIASIEAIDVPEELQQLLKIAKPKDGSAYELPPLDFAYDSLEPFIDEKTMRAHYLGHHAGYKNKMNAVLKQWSETNEGNDLASQPIIDTIKNINDVPMDFRENLQNQGGGFVNHAWYWATLSPSDDPKAKRTPIEVVSEAVNRRYGNFQLLQKEFNETALDFFGSGYVWLCEVPPSNVLQIITFPNQMSPLAFDLKPILVLDVWEHAYYLKHQNKRAKYIDDWWHVTDWAKVERISKAWKGELDDAKDEL